MIWLHVDDFYNIVGIYGLHALKKFLLNCSVALSYKNNFMMIILLVQEYFYSQCSNEKCNKLLSRFTPFVGDKSGVWRRFM